MTAPYRTAKLTKNDKPLFVGLMSRAFARDPLFLYIFGDSEVDRKANSRMTAFLSFIFDSSFMLHEEIVGVFEHERLLGAYVVEKPSASKLMNVIGGLLLIGRLVPLLFRISSPPLGLLNAYMRITRSAAPSVPHHYLIMIGVEPEAQGKGIGGTLLLHLLHAANADQLSQGILLDTENKENVAWYRKNGFLLHRETQLHDVPVYCMLYRK
ncbi:GNAT family N-acetyltransferase [Paenibacillus oenotherae]|uniref:GNAT family N-acetyltransferase n=1 Tax=Paenibacillus oenotherae TaxID=1435645 RepID=A0ABS7DDS6_9BACL|nr:GNAT family N-acetyltransferase [Paenibacillus oenotherae]MBW7477323.1 GNAT family N-acetyltransferase [Paenibacillus oenotherae]